MVNVCIILDKRKENNEIFNHKGMRKYENHINNKSQVVAMSLDIATCPCRLTLVMVDEYTNNPRDYCEDIF